MKHIFLLLLILVAVTQAELLLNGSFEQSDYGTPNNWYFTTTQEPYGDGSVVYVQNDPENAYHGADYLVLDATGTGSEFHGSARCYQNITDFVEGVEYTLSAYIRVDALPSVQPQITLNWFDGPYDFIDGITIWPEVIADGNYHLVSITGVIPVGPTRGFLQILVRDDTGFDVAPIYLDNLSLIPEPATLSLLAFGGLALLRKRK